MSSKKLSVSQIFSSPDFVDEGFDRPRWSKNGNTYTTLRRVECTSSSLHVTSVAADNSDLTSTTGSACNAINTTVHEIIRHDVSNGTESILVSRTQLTPTGETSPLSVDDYTVAEDCSKVLLLTQSKKVWRLKTKGSYWVLDLNAAAGSPGALRQLGVGLDPASPNATASDLKFATFSPDLQNVAYVFENNLYVEDRYHNIVPLTNDGSEMIINGTFDWVYEEEFGIYDGFRWSPDSTKIAYWQIDQTGVGIVNLVNNTDSLYPKLNPIPYPKCGEPNPSARVGIVCLPSSGSSLSPRTAWVDFADNDSRNNYICDMSFIERKSHGRSDPTQQLVIQRLNRLQNHLEIISVVVSSDKDGDVLTQSLLYCEDSDAWIDVNKPLRWLSIATPTGMGKNNFLLLLSEQNGWRQIFLTPNNDNDYSSNIVAVTPIGVDVESVCGYDDHLKLVYFIASPGDPLRRFLYSASLALLGNESAADREPLAFSVQRVTPLDDSFRGTNGYSLSKDGKFAVHTICSAQQPVSTSIVSLPSHVRLCSLATNSRLQGMFQSLTPSPDKVGGISPIEFFKVPIDGAELDVIFYVYGEPAACTVRDRWAGKVGIWHRLLAQRGAVVISVDNRGTPSLKGAAWRKHIYKAIGSAPSSDQVLALNYILESRPYLDPARVGIWGWSGGGSMSLNMLFRYPNKYTTAVSVAPVPDMRLYDTIYQERYMATPQANAEGYFNGSPINFAKNMRDSQNLLVIHGTGDDNCHYQGVECLVNELIFQKKQFRMFSYPNRSHSISEGIHTTEHLFCMITDYFKEKGLIV